MTTGAVRDSGGVPSDRWYEAIAEFAGHIVGGTAIFLLIGLAAWVLHQFTVAIGSSSTYLLYGLGGVEIIVFAADVLLFLLFVGRTFWRAARRLLRGWNS